MGCLQCRQPEPFQRQPAGISQNRSAQEASSRKAPHTIPFLNSSSGYFVPRQTMPSFQSVRTIDRSSV